MVEKRRASRVRVHLQAQYRSPTVRFDGVVSDLSQDGLFLHAAYLETRGVRVSVALALPDAPEPLSLRGEVVRVVDAAPGAGMGIRFTAIGTDERLSLANFMLRSACPPA